MDQGIAFLNANKEAVTLFAAYVAYVAWSKLGRRHEQPQELNRQLKRLELQGRGEGQNNRRDPLQEIKQHVNPKYLRDLQAGRLTEGQERRLLRRLDRIYQGDPVYSLVGPAQPSEHDWMTSVELGTDADRLDLEGSEELERLRPDRKGARYYRLHNL